VAIPTRNGSVARQRLLKNVPAASNSTAMGGLESTRVVGHRTNNRCAGEGQQQFSSRNTHATIEELLNASFYIPFAFFQKKVGCHFFPELLLINYLIKSLIGTPPAVGCDSIDPSEEVLLCPSRLM
jgi:hypothetical protein